jgi:DNA repair ATPase RecN
MADDSLTPTSPRARLKRAVFGKAVQHPLTLYPTAVGVLGVLALGLFGASGAAVGAIGAGFGIGLGSWALNYYLRGDRLAAQIQREARAAIEHRKQELLADLQDSLKGARRFKTVAEYAEQAIDQYDMIQKRFANFQGLLEKKVNPGELSYTRFFAVGEQVYLAVLDNLNSIAARLQGISTIEPDYIEERLASLARLKQPVPADVEEIKTLEQRRTLRTQQLDRINELLTFNESALTEFDQVNTVVAEMRAVDRNAAVDLETAARELQGLVDRARRLSQAPVGGA